MVNQQKKRQENQQEKPQEKPKQNQQKPFKLLPKPKHYFLHFFSSKYKGQFWRLLELSGIPVLLFFGGNYFENKIHEQQQKIQDRQSQQQALENYIESMKKILIGEEYHNGLSELKIPEEDEKNEKNEILLDELSSIARARTVTVLQSINDKKRRKLLIDFLRDAKVGFIERTKELDSLEVSKKIKEEPKLSLLIGISLAEADLSGADLALAILSGADLSGADLSGATLSSAYLKNARLFKVKLSEAFLIGTDLREADLREANLRGAKLEGANLRKADLTGAEYFREQIKSACFWQQATYLEYKNANKRFIEELKKDSASDPKEPVDCSLWEHLEYPNQP